MRSPEVKRFSQESSEKTFNQERALLHEKTILGRFRGRAREIAGVLLFASALACSPEQKKEAFSADTAKGERVEDIERATGVEREAAAAIEMLRGALRQDPDLKPHEIREALRRAYFYNHRQSVGGIEEAARALEKMYGEGEKDDPSALRRAIQSFDYLKDIPDDARILLGGGRGGERGTAYEVGRTPDESDALRVLNSLDGISAGSPAEKRRMILEKLQEDYFSKYDRTAEDRRAAFGVFRDALNNPAIVKSLRDDPDTRRVIEALLRTAK